MSDLTELAKQCGASIGIKTTVARGTEPYVFITGAQLAAFVERIREEERGRCAKQYWQIGTMSGLSDLLLALQKDAAIREASK